MHAHLLGQQVPLAGIAARAGGQDVRPGVRAASREGHEMVARQALALAQLLLRAAAELAAVIVAGKQERVGDLAPEAARDVDKANESDDRGTWDRESLAVDRRAFSLNNFSLAVNDQPQRPAHGHHG